MNVRIKILVQSGISLLSNNWIPQPCPLSKNFCSQQFWLLHPFIGRKWFPFLVWSNYHAQSLRIFPKSILANLLNFMLMPDSKNTLLTEIKIIFTFNVAAMIAIAFDRIDLASIAAKTKVDTWIFVSSFDNFLNNGKSILALFVGVFVLLWFSFELISFLPIWTCLPKLELHDKLHKLGNVVVSKNFSFSFAHKAIKNVFLSIANRTVELILFVKFSWDRLVGRDWQCWFVCHGFSLHWIFVGLLATVHMVFRWKFYLWEINFFFLIGSFQKSTFPLIYFALGVVESFSKTRVLGRFVSGVGEKFAKYLGGEFFTHFCFYL